MQFSIFECDLGRSKKALFCALRDNVKNYMLEILVLEGLKWVMETKVCEPNIFQAAIQFSSG